MVALTSERTDPLTATLTVALTGVLAAALTAHALLWTVY